MKHHLQRYCCTISLCTYPVSTQHFWEQNVDGQNTSSQGSNGKSFSVFDEVMKLSDLSASEDFYNGARCLVPYSHKDPKKWKSYEMHNYRKASSEEELKKVDQFKHDNNFLNMEDPKVFKYFTKSTKSLKNAWMKTYGFPFVAQPYVTLPVLFKVSSLVSNELTLNSTKCLEKCARYVSMYNMIYSLRIQFSRNSPNLLKTVERRVAFSSVVSRNMPCTASRRFGTN